MSDYKIIKADSKHDYAQCVAIRTLVFVAEQGYPLHEDFGEREELWEDWLLSVDDKPAVTARSRMLNDETGRIGMIAALEEYRGQGYSKQLVGYLTELLSKNDKIKKIQISAQDYALPFYEKLGYEIVGDGYMEGHIPHHKVIKEVA